MKQYCVLWLQVVQFYFILTPVGITLHFLIHPYFLWFILCNLNLYCILWNGIHCVKGFQIRSYYFWSIFPCISPNTGNLEPKITPYLDTFHAVIALYITSCKKTLCLMKDTNSYCATWIIGQNIIKFIIKYYIIKCNIKSLHVVLFHSTKCKFILGNIKS